MKEAANIAASIKHLFGLSPTLPALIPGGLLYGIEKAGTEYPYASLTIEPGDAQWMTGVTYTQEYRVKIRVWGTQEIGDSDTIQESLEGLMGMTTKLTILGSGVHTLQCVLEPYSIDEDPERNLGENVFINSASWVITLQEHRKP
jgi:hypothetical protein